MGVLQADVPGLRERLKSTIEDKKDSETDLVPALCGHWGFLVEGIRLGFWCFFCSL